MILRRIQLAGAVSLIASTAAIGAGVLSSRPGGTYADLQTGAATNSGLMPCYGICALETPPVVVVGSCFSGEVCCGWVMCDQPGLHSLACCQAAGQCRYDKNTDPPGTAWCNLFP